MIAFVWAQAENGIIGKDSVMPWHLPNDLKHFKNVTLNQTIVMGRKTYEGMDNTPLPKRKTLLVTRQEDYDVPDEVELCHSKEEVLAYAKEHDADLYIIGGSQIYELFMDEVDVLHQTVIHEEFEGDASFPEMDWDKFEEVERQHVSKEEGHDYAHTFYKHVRK